MVQYALHFAVMNVLPVSFLSYVTEDFRLLETAIDHTDVMLQIWVLETLLRCFLAIEYFEIGFYR